ncbi:hypothetical protein [Paracraurococcus lichenis]|uniref:Prevent-host-death protein n=1 Tax=Paracraurococcus lichenis TaxID=3064888 RepID=A0ABT9DX08_9PROT|nr:hypothetical protein [Paracraurococcus sp. LOR1-02]MDO9708433.1 hypothetical protein [Paracraurococcus sp. LOR1-02]
MPQTLTIDEAEFQASVPALVEGLGARGLDRVEVTRGGQVVAILTPPEAAPTAGADIYGFMRGSVVIPPGYDLTAPVLERFLAEEQDRFED